MNVSTALRQARLRAGLDQRDLGRRVGYSPQMVSAVEKGVRELAPDVRLSIAELLDDPDLYLALAEEATGGVMVPAVLDGPRVDLHRVATGVKLAEEATEVLAVWASWKSVTSRPGSPEERHNAKVYAHQVYELLTACGVTLAVLCREYGLSPAELAREHLAELRAKGYAAKEGAKRDAKGAA